MTAACPGRSPGCGRSPGPMALPLRADPLHRRLGVLRQGAAHAPDPFVRRARQEPLSLGPAAPTAATRRTPAAAARHAPRPPRPASPPPGRRPRTGTLLLRRLHQRPAQRRHRSADQGGQLRRTPAPEPRGRGNGTGSRPAWTAARGRRPRRPDGPEARERSCTSGGFSVNSSSNWSTTRQRLARDASATGRSRTAPPPGPRSGRAPAGRPCHPPAPGPAPGPARARGASPGWHTRPTQPSGRDGSSPARRNDVFPAPEGPISPRSLSPSQLRPTAPRPPPHGRRSAPRPPL